MPPQHLPEPAEPASQPRSGDIGAHPSGEEVIAAAHRAAEAAGMAGYLDPETGLFVLTAAYLRARGSCCENQCRHCPFGTGDARRGSR